MAVLVISEVPGLSSEQDDAMIAALDLTGSPPPGARLRLAGPMDGGLRIVSLWESRDQYEAFVEERLKPALQAAGRPVPEGTARATMGAIGAAALDVWEIEKVHSFA